MTIVVTYDGVASTIIPDLMIEHVDRELFGSVRDVYEEVPGREGAWLFSEEAGDRTISMPCHISSTDATTRRATVRQIALWLLKSDRKQLIISDESDRYWDAKLMTAPKLNEIREWGTFTLDWRTGPYAWATSLSTKTISNASNTGVYTEIFSIVDDLPAFPVIRVTALTTGTAGFNLGLNGNTLAYGGTMAIGDIINFSSISYTATSGADYDVNLTGAFQIGSSIMAFLTGTFGYLTPGNNSLTINALSVGGQEFSIDVVWRRRFL